MPIPASDVYSLGAILYEPLTGRPPFLGETPHAVIEQVKSLDPIPIRRLKPGIPTDLDTVCLKCPEKEPRRRYASAVELADDLTRFLVGEQVRAQPVGPAGSLLRMACRHPWRAAAVVLAATILAGAGVALAWKDYMHDSCDVFCHVTGAGSAMPWEVGNALENYFNFTTGFLLPTLIANDLPSPLVGGGAHWEADGISDD